MFQHIAIEGWAFYSMLTWFQFLWLSLTILFGLGIEVQPLKFNYEAEHQPAPWHILYLGRTVLHSEMRGKQHVVHTAVCNGLEQQLSLPLEFKWQKSDVYIDIV